MTNDEIKSYISELRTDLAQWLPSPVGKLELSPRDAAMLDEIERRCMHPEAGAWSMDVGLAMVRDAERYRWIRDKANDWSLGKIKDDPTQYPNYDPQQLDADIDAAMAESSTPQPERP